MRRELVNEAKAALDALAVADIGGCDRAGLDLVLGDLDRVRRVVTGFDIEIARRSRQLAELGRSECASGVLGERGRRSGREARDAAQREQACARVPGFEAALSDGAVTAGHLDALAAATHDLADDATAQLADHADELLAAAASESVDDFRRTCRALVRTLDADDGTSRLERQRSQRRVSRWADRITGMWNMRVELDPVTGARVDAALDAATRAARAAAIKGEDVNYDHAVADALVDLITGARSVDQRVPDVAVHIDLRTLLEGLHEHSLCELADGTTIPVSTVRRLCCQAEIFPVVFGTDGEVLDLGRSQRLANRAQRRALRAMYRTCSVPGCDVPFDRCEIHHVVPWERLGLTDLVHLTPICGSHHHLVHEGGWTLHLAPDRTITLTRPDGTVHCRGSTIDRRPDRWAGVSGGDRSADGENGWGQAPTVRHATGRAMRTGTVGA